MRTIHSVIIGAFMNKNKNIPKFNEEKIKILKEKRDIRGSFLYCFLSYMGGLCSVNTWDIFSGV